MLSISLFFLLFSAPNHAGNVYLITSADTKISIEASQKIGKHLTQTDPSISFNVVDINDLKKSAITTDDLLVPIGTTASQKVNQNYSDNPVLASFISTHSTPKNRTNWAAVITDQPLQRLISPVSPLLKHRYKKDILLTISSDNTHVLDESKKLNVDNLKTVAIPATENPAKKIGPHLYKAGALIATNDKHIWTGENARWMLYQAYRNNVSVVGYSKKFLKAGALIAIYSTIEQIAFTTAQQIEYWYTHQKLKRNGVIYSNYNIEYNKKIARTLKIQVPENKFNVESDQ